MVLSKADALASIAYLTLEVHGKAENPSLHDIAVAVTRAAPLLNMTTPEEIAYIDEAVKTLASRHDWRGDDWMKSLLGENIIMLPRRNRGEGI